MNETPQAKSDTDATRHATPVGLLMDLVDWKRVEYETPPSLVTDHLPHVTHEGILNFCGAKFRVYQLSSGERVIDADDVKLFFGAL